MSEEKDNVIELEGSLTEVREGLKKIELDKRFIIFALDYGVGKTRLIEDKIISGELPEGNFFTLRHDRIDETTQKFEKEGFNDYQHIYGFTQEKGGCPEYSTNEDIKDYYKYLPAGLICQIVCKGKTTCPYRDQFDNDKAWQFAPHEFLNTPKLKKKPFNVVDEDPKTFDEIEFAPDTVNLGVLEKYTGKSYNSEYELTSIQEWEIPSAITKARENGEKEELKELMRINTLRHALLRILRSDIKPLDDVLHVPKIFRVFDLLREDKKAQVILLDGGFDLELFKHLKKLYSLDIPNPVIYKSNLQNKSTKVIRVNQSKSYFRGEKGDRSWDWDLAYFFDPITLIVSLQRQGKKVGIITAKEIEEKFKMDGVITSHYGDTSGTNKFVGCTALILFVEHNWRTLDLAKYYQKLFGKYPREEKNRKVKKKGMKMAYHVMDSASIEAGFRIRPLEHNVEIYFFRRILNTFKQKFSADEKDLEEFIEEPITEVNFPEIAKLLAHAQYAKNRTDILNLMGYSGTKYSLIKILCEFRYIKL